MRSPGAWPFIFLGHVLEPVYPCFNREMVDAGHAEIVDYTNNEFNLADGWRP